VPNEDDLLTPLLAKMPLRKGVPGPTFQALLRDCLALYSRSVEAGERLTWFKRKLKVESLRRDLRRIQKLENEGNLAAFGSELARVKKWLQSRLMLAQVTQDARKEMDPDGFLRGHLRSLILCLHALRHLVDLPRFRLKYLPAFLPDVLNGARVLPPRGKKWSSYSVHQTLKRAGGAGESDCVAVCLFSTEEALRPFRPSHRVDILVDREGHQKPRLTLIRENLRTKSSMMFLWNVDTLIAMETADKTRPFPELLFLPSPAKTVPCRRSLAQRILVANGRAVFRGLPVLTGQHQPNDRALSHDSSTN